MKRLYLKIHLGLKRQCDRLSPLQRKITVFGLSLIYLCCSLGMIVRFFSPSDYRPAEEKRFRELIDSPVRTDSLRPERLPQKHYAKNYLNTIEYEQ